MKKDDNQIWERIKAGDKNALTDLHDIYFHQMCLYAYKICKNPEIVEELVSDCFIKIWEQRQRIEIRKSVKGYIFLSLRNGIIDFHRKKQMYFEGLDQVINLPEEEYFDEQQQYAVLYKAMQKLPEQRRRILELAVYESMTYQQIGDTLNISKNTVRTQVYRAYRNLKEALNPHDFYFLSLLRKSVNVLSN